MRRLNLVKSTAADPVADFERYLLPFNEAGEVYFTIYRKGIKPYVAAERKRQRATLAETLPLLKEARATLARLQEARPAEAPEKEAPEGAAPEADPLAFLDGMRVEDLEGLLRLSEKQLAMGEREEDTFLLIRTIEGLRDEDTGDPLAFSEEIAKLVCEEPFVRAFVHEKAEALQARYDAFLERARGNSAPSSDGSERGTAGLTRSTENVSNVVSISGD